MIMKLNWSYTKFENLVTEVPYLKRELDAGRDLLRDTEALCFASNIIFVWRLWTVMFQFEESMMSTCLW